MSSYRFRALTLLVLLLASAAAWSQALSFSTFYAAQSAMQCVPTASIRDASGNFYLTGNAEAYIFTEKVNAAGTVLWKNFLASGRTVALSPNAIALGKAGSVFVTAMPQNVGPTAQNLLLFSISSTGATQWQVSVPNHTGFGGLVLDSSDDPIVAERLPVDPVTSQTSFDLASYSAAKGALLWSKNQADSSGTLQFVALSGDGAGGVFCLEVNGSSQFPIVKFATATGNMLWSKTITALQYETFQTPQFLTALSSGDQVVSGTGSFNTGSTYYTRLTFDRLRDSDGAFVYRTQVGDTTQGASTTLSVAPVSSGDNLFWGGKYNLSPSASGIAGSINSAGSATWQGTNATSPTSTLTSPNSDGGGFAYFVEGGASASAALARFSNTGTRLWTDPLADTTPVNLTAFAGTPSATMKLTSPLLDSAYAIQSFNGSTGALSLNFSDRPFGYASTAASASAKDSSGDVFVAGKEAHHIIVTKYSAAGAVAWSMVLNPTQAIWEGSPVSLSWSPLGELSLAAWLFTNVGTGGVELGLAKISAASGAVIWSTLYPSSRSLTYPEQCLEDASGNVIVVSNTGPVSHLIFDKFDGATGKNLWEYVQPDNFDSESAFGLDSAGNAFACGLILYYSNGSIYSGFNLVAVSSAGKLLYEKLHTPSKGAGPFQVAVGVSAAGAATLGFTDGKTLQAATYSLAGTELWYKSWTPSTPPAQLQILPDSAHGVVYLLCRLQKPVISSPAYLMTLKCRQSDGFQFWYSIFTGAGGVTAPWYADVDSFGNVVQAIAVPTTQNGVSGNTTYIRKLASANGAIRYSATVSAKYTTLLDSNQGLFAHGQLAVLVQTTPSLAGASSTAELVSAFADTNAPICYNDSYSATKNTTLTISAPGVLGNDEDAGSASAILVAGPTHASSFTLNATGGFAYTPATGFTGTDTFTYKAQNAYGMSNVATVVITVK